MKKSRVELNDDQKTEIITAYGNGEKIPMLRNKFNISAERISNLLKDAGVNLRKRGELRTYSINQSYFEEIDTEDKSYFLGLLYADGNQGSGPSSRVRIELAETDKDILDRFNDCLDTNKPLYFRNLREKNPNWQNTYTLEINSKKISADLLNWGLVPAKTFKIKFPDFLREDLIIPFIRGYVDGDGCLFRSSVTICGNVEFCEQLRQIIFDLTGIKSALRLPQNHHPDFRVLIIEGGLNVKKFLTWLYGDSKIHMERRYQKYLSFLEWSPKPKKNLLRGNDGDLMGAEEKRIRTNSRARDRWQRIKSEKVTK
jgi:hypothetical protein